MTLVTFINAQAKRLAVAQGYWVFIFVLPLLFSCGISPNENKYSLNIKTLEFRRLKDKQIFGVILNEKKRGNFTLIDTNSNIIRIDSVLNINSTKFFMPLRQRENLNIAVKIKGVVYFFVFNKSNSNYYKLARLIKYESDTSFNIYKTKNTTNVQLNSLFNSNISNLISEKLYYKEYFTLNYKYLNSELYFKFISINGQNWVIEPPLYDKIKKPFNMIYYDVGSIIDRLP